MDLLAPIIERSVLMTHTSSSVTAPSSRIRFIKVWLFRQ